MPEQSVHHQKETDADQQTITILKTNESCSDENCPNAGYPRRDHRFVRTFAGGVQEENINREEYI